MLHLKRALGEIETGDAVPAPLPVIQAKPPPPKVPKTTAKAPQSGPPPNFSLRGASAAFGGKGGPGPAAPGLVGADPSKESQHQLSAMQKEIASALGSSMGQGGPPPGPFLPPPGPQEAAQRAQMQAQAQHAAERAQAQQRAQAAAAAAAAAAQAAQAAQSGGGAGSSIAAQIAAAAGPGKNTVQIEIPQAKAAIVIGKNGATLNAIKSYSKAQCFVEQRTPDEDKARVSIVGSPTEIEKCKQTVFAVVDGTMSLATLCSLAGVPMPAGDRDDSGGRGGAAPPAAPAAFPGLPPFGGLPMAMPAVGAVPGMPENQQMQQNLNDYYARSWMMQMQGQQAKKPEVPAGPAFDKEALAKLAERAASGVEEPPPPPSVNEPPPGPPGGGPSPEMSSLEAEVARLRAENERLRAGNAAVSSTPPPPAPPAPGGYSPSTSMSSSAPGMSMQMNNQKRMADVTLKGFLNPRAMEAQKPQKDDESVAKMLERLQGNQDANKQAVDLGAQVKTPAGGRAAWDPAVGLNAFREDLRTRADVEFEALTSRMQSASEPADMDTIAREVLIRFASFNPQQVVELLQKLDGASGLQHHQNGDFLAEMCRLVVPRLKEFASQQFTSLTSTFASWTSEARGDKRKRGSRFMEFSKAFFSMAAQEMSSRLMTFAPHELNCCLAAFVSVGYSDHKFFASVARAALARHSSFAPVQLTALLAILSEMRLVHGDLFNSAGAFLSTRAKELRPVDMIRVLRSFSKCNVQHQGVCKAISDEVLSRTRDPKTASSFKAEDICEIAWALMVLNHYHEGLFRTMFQFLEKTQMITTDALLQVYECHLALEAEYGDQYRRYAIDPDVVDQLQDHYKENRKDERRCSEKQRNDVASALKSLVDGSVHVNHRTSSGLLVDVAALRKRSSTDGFVHVDLDSNVTTVKALDQDDPAQAVVVEGAVAMRRRLLQKAGLRLVTVKESDWRDLDDSKEKRRHLRSLLSALGDVLE